MSDMKYVRYVGVDGKVGLRDYDLTINKVYKTSELKPLNSKTGIYIIDDVEDSNFVLSEHLQPATEQQYLAQFLGYDGDEYVTITKKEYEELLEIKQSYEWLQSRNNIEGEY